MSKNPVKILLADDDTEDRFIMEDAFNEISRPGVIDFVEDGELVIQYLDNIRNDNALPCLIVLDLNMPRLSGTDTLRLLKNNARYQNIPVQIFSTSVNEIEKEQCLKLGATDYIIKPIKYAECLDIARHFYEFCVKK